MLLHLYTVHISSCIYIICTISCAWAVNEESVVHNASILGQTLTIYGLVLPKLEGRAMHRTHSMQWCAMPVEFTLHFTSWLIHHISLIKGPMLSSHWLWWMRFDQYHIVLISCTEITGRWGLLFHAREAQSGGWPYILIQCSSILSQK